MMFKRILVPLDGSELAEKVLPQVQDLAKSQDAQVTLMTAGDLPGATGLIGSEILKQAEADEKETSEKYLEQTANSLKHKGLTVNWIYKRGQAATEIVATAKAENMDLIAIATHGGGEVAWSVGNVAEKVVSYAPVPVLLLPVVEPKLPGLKAEWFMGA
jgi:nucleotide-binding universal stress UspA family protein